MPKLYGNKPQQVFAEGDNIEDIIPLDDINPPSCGIGEGETDTTTHAGGVTEEKAGTIGIGVIDDEANVEGVSGEISTTTTDRVLIEEKAGDIQCGLVDADRPAKEVEGIIDKNTADNKPTIEEAGSIEIDVIDDLVPVEKAGIISTTIDPGDVCIND